MSFTRLALVVSAWAVAGLSASAETLPCTKFIDALPFNITTPGHYCLARSLTTSAGGGVFIYADDVVLDLQGFTMTNAVAAAELPDGVFADSRQNVSVRNGTLRGFHGGVLLADALRPGRALGYVVEDVRVQESGLFGISVTGFNSIVRRCNVTDTGGTTAAGAGNAFGIIVAHGAAQVLDNSVLGFFPTGTGTAVGIDVNSGNFLLIRNHVEGGTTGPTVGIRINSTEGGYRDNVVWRTTKPYLGGIDLGNNASF